jgi:hypothetical protein
VDIGSHRDKPLPFPATRHRRDGGDSCTLEGCTYAHFQFLLPLAEAATGEPLSATAATLPTMTSGPSIIRRMLSAWVTPFAVSALAALSRRSARRG